MNPYSNTSTLTSPSAVGTAISLWVHISAVITRHSGGAFAAIRFLTAHSKFTAVNLTTSGSVNGSTSLPASVDTMFPSVGLILSVIIRFFYSFVSFLRFYSAFLNLPGLWYLGSLLWLHLVFLSLFCDYLSLSRKVGDRLLIDFKEAILEFSHHSLVFTFVELSHCRAWQRIPYQPMSSNTGYLSDIHPPGKCSIHTPVLVSTRMDKDLHTVVEPRMRYRARHQLIITPMLHDS